MPQAYNGTVEVDWIIYQDIQNVLPLYYYETAEDGTRKGRDVSDRNWRAIMVSQSGKRVELLVDASKAKDGIVRVIMTTSQASDAKLPVATGGIGRDGSLPDVGRYAVEFALPGEDYQRDVRGRLRLSRGL